MDEKDAGRTRLEARIIQLVEVQRDALTVFTTLGDEGALRAAEMYYNELQQLQSRLRLDKIYDEKDPLR